MAANVPLHRRLLTAATWPVGVVITSFTYIWRVTPMYRQELPGTPERDLPPPLPQRVAVDEVQAPRDGAGPLFHRRYRGTILETDWTPERLMECVAPHPGRVAPRSLARFQKTHGPEDRMQVGDEWLVRMPGPWDGPVRVVEVTPCSFRFATLDGHLEAGQIEWRAYEAEGALVFQVESWARAGSGLSALLHDHLRMAKEVQLHMWSSVVEKVRKLTGGRLATGIEIVTWRVEREELEASAWGRQ